MSDIAVQPFTGTYRAQPVALDLRLRGPALRHLHLPRGDAGGGGDAPHRRGRARAGGLREAQSISIHEPAELRAHLFAADFFETATHPEVAFRSTDLRLGDDGSLELDGELTIRGVSRPIAATGAWSGPNRAAFGTIAGPVPARGLRPPRLRLRLAGADARRRPGARLGGRPRRRPAADRGDCLQRSLQWETQRRRIAETRSSATIAAGAGEVLRDLTRRTTADCAWGPPGMERHGQGSQAQRRGRDRGRRGSGGGCGSGSGSGSTGTVARVVAPACRGADLKITAERHSLIGSGGTNYTTLLITDQSSQPCIVGGVPKVVGFGPGGKTIEEAERQPDLTPGARPSPAGAARTWRSGALPRRPLRRDRRGPLQSVLDLRAAGDDSRCRDARGRAPDDGLLREAGSRPLPTGRPHRMTAVAIG